MAAAFTGSPQASTSAALRNRGLHRDSKQHKVKLHLQASCKRTDSVQLWTSRDVDVGSEIKPIITPVRTLIVDNYDSYTYNLFQMLSVANGEAPVVIRNNELSFRELHRRLKDFDNIVISPGPGSPLHPADIGVCMELFQECDDIPILGVCMGHQVLGCAHGMKIVHAPQPVHGRLSEVEHCDHPLFEGIPSGSSFKVVRYHSLTLDISSLPLELIPTAWTASEKPIAVGSSESVREARVLEASSEFSEQHLLMGISHRTRPHHGVQFHPESVATKYGQEILENFSDMTRLYWNSHSRKCSGTSAKRHTLGSLKPSVTKMDRAELKLSFRRLEGSLTACGGSETLFTSLYGAEEAQNTFWLDSSIGDQERARFSYMGGRGGDLWKKLTFNLDRRVLRAEDSAGHAEERELDTTGFFDFLDQELQSYSCGKKQLLPFDFTGGYVGYLGYELKSECGPSSNRFKSDVPDAAFFMVDRFIVVDHLTNDIYILALSDENMCNVDVTEAWLEETEKSILKLQGLEADDLPNFTEKQSVSLTPLKDRTEYMNDVRKCLEYITDGESYEICLTTQLRRSLESENLLGLYRVLRRTNPAPYAAWLNFGKEGPCICCSSPERFLRLDQAGVLEAKPIKGTAPRGKSHAEDEMLRLQLEQSEKDQAENLMIVDLLRNDLGRVCVPGSVHVPKLMAIESYSTVHTMVSTVRGTKKEDATPVQCVKAAFPGGSMTGAPKLRTMEILDTLESSARGVYSGAIGFFSFNSSFDLNIVIRTMVIHDGTVSLGAGGAVVAMSDPESEHEEMLLKTRAPVKALDIFNQLQ